MAKRLGSMAVIDLVEKYLEEALKNQRFWGGIAD